MLNVLIVDDEPYIRQGLGIIIDWMRYGYVITAEADSGKKAIEILQTKKIDLIIADIKMPEMNGLELINYVRENLSKDIKFIILSGYYEFEYAKQAIHNQVAEYLLKPINKDELISSLVKIREELNLSEESRIIEKNKNKIIYQQHLMNIIQGRFDSDDVIYVNKYLSFSSSMKYISFEFSERDEKFGVLPLCEKLNAQKNCFNLLQEMLSEYSNNAVFGVGKDDDIFDFGFICIKDIYYKRCIKEKEYITRLYEALEKQFGFSLRILIGQKVDSVEKLSDSYQSALVARSFMLFSENQKIIEYYDEAAGKRDERFGIDSKLMENLISSVKNNLFQEIEESVDKIYDELKEKMMNPKVVSTNIYYLLYRLADLAKEFSSDDQEEVMQFISQETFDKIAVRGSVSQFKQFAVEYAGYLSELKNNVSKGVLPKIEKYIKTNYMQNLSLKFLGEKFYINSVYLGQIFKKEYGIAFKDYLTVLRINQAIVLLETTDLKVYNIASSVGFNNPDYFINKFVQVKGITPHQYRLNYKSNS